MAVTLVQSQQAATDLNDWEVTNLVRPTSQEWYSVLVQWLEADGSSSVHPSTRYGIIPPVAKSASFVFFRSSSQEHHC